MIVYFLIKKLVVLISTPIVSFLIKLGVIINDPRKVEIAVLIVLVALFGACFNMIRVSKFDPRPDASFSANAFHAVSSGFENSLNSFFVGLFIGVFLLIPWIIKKTIQLYKYFNTKTFKKLSPSLSFPISLVLAILIVAII